MKIEVEYIPAHRRYSALYPERFEWRVFKPGRFFASEVAYGSVPMGSDIERTREAAIAKARKVAETYFYTEDVSVETYDALQSRIQRLETELLDNPNN